MAKMTQTERIRRHLETFGSISSYEAFKEYGCTRLSARIWDLTRKDGLFIERERKTARNRFDEPVSYVVYRLGECEKNGKTTTSFPELQ